MLKELQEVDCLKQICHLEEGILFKDNPEWQL